MYKLSLILISILQIPYVTYSQNDTLQGNNLYQQQDIKDWVAKRKSKEPKPVKSNYLLIVPFISSNPTAGFMIGGGLSYTFKTLKSDEHVSLISSNISYSTKKLVNLNVKSNVFVMHEKLFLNGDWRYLINSETTYGLGTDKPVSSSIDINGQPTSTDSLGQSLKYSQFRLHETGSWKLFTNFFAGIGFQYDRYFNITDDKVVAGDTSMAHHYQYSREHGFDPTHYITSGFSINFLFDSRDNQVNAYKGYYANINYRVNQVGMGSTENSTLLLTEYRSFHALDKNKRNILGFWLYGNFLTSGNAPYLALPALGYDQRQRTGRGYRFGEFRGENMVYGETEYRFPISIRTGILGGVLFLNSTSTSDKKNNIALLDYMRFGYGGGLRIMLDKTSRSRLQIDAGLSKGSFGFYLGALETF